MPITWEQIQTTPYQDVMKNSELAKALGSLWWGPQDWSFIYRIPEADFNAVRPQVLDPGKLYASAFNSPFERFANWNSPSADPATKAAAIKAKQEAEANLKERSDYYKRIGIDPSSEPHLNQLKSVLGMTSEEAAKDPSAFYSKVTGIQQTPMNVPARTTISEQSPDVITIGRGSDTMQIMKADLEYWKSQGWDYNQTDGVAAASQGAAGGANGGVSGGVSTDYSKLPPDILNSQDWLNSNESQRKLIALTYNSLASGNAATNADAAAALEKATQLADPYFKQQIRLAQDELMRDLSGTGADAQSVLARKQSRLQELQQDLAYGRENLSMDQQVELAHQMDQYKQDLDVTQRKFTEAGLAFSSPRAEAEKRLAQQLRESAESVNRQTARKLRELEVGTLRDTQGTAADIADVGRKAAEQSLGIYRQAESQLGSRYTPKYEGMSQLGDVVGTTEQKNQADVLGIQGEILDRNNPLTV